MRSMISAALRVFVVNTGGVQTGAGLEWVIGDRRQEFFDHALHRDEQPYIVGDAQIAEFLQDFANHVIVLDHAAPQSAGIHP